MTLVLNNIDFMDYTYCKANSTYINDCIIQLKNKLKYKEFKKILNFITKTNVKLFGKNKTILDFTQKIDETLSNLILTLDEKINLADEDINIIFEIFEKKIDSNNNNTIFCILSKCDFIKNIDLMFYIINNNIKNSDKYFLNFIKDNVQYDCLNHINVFQKIILNDSIFNMIYNSNKIIYEYIDLIINKFKLFDDILKNLGFSDLYAFQDKLNPKNKINIQNKINIYLDIQEYVNIKFLNSDKLNPETIIKYIKHILNTHFMLNYMDNNALISENLENINKIRKNLEKIIKTKLDEIGFQLKYYDILLNHFDNNNYNDSDLFKYFISIYPNYPKLNKFNIKNVLETNYIPNIIRYLPYLLPKNIDKQELKIIIDLIISYRHNDEIKEYLTEYIDSIQLDKTTMKYALYAKNLDIIEYMLNQKYIFTDDDFLLINCIDGDDIGDIFKILQILNKYNYYLNDNNFIDFCINNSIKSYQFEGLQKYSVYKDDDEKYNIKKEEYQKIIDFKELSVASIEDYMDDPKNTFDLKFIYTHSTPFVRILLKRYMDNKN